MRAVSATAICYLLCLCTAAYGGSSKKQGTPGAADLIKIDGFKAFAIGDFNSDRMNDIIGTNEDGQQLMVWLWDPLIKGFLRGPTVDLNINQSWLGASMAVRAMIASDFDGDGRMDILVSFEVAGGSGDNILSHHIYRNDQEQLVLWLTEDALPKSKGELTVVDMFGRVESNLLLEEAEEKSLSVLRITSSLSSTDNSTLVGNVDKFSCADLLWRPPRLNGSFCTELLEWHSNGVGDLDGDCRPDIWLTCIAKETFLGEGTDVEVAKGAPYIEVWLNGKPLSASSTATPGTSLGCGYRLGKQFPWPGVDPSGESLLSIADLDGDGAMDLVLASHSDNKIYMYRNSQRRVCGHREMPDDGPGGCREMCRATLKDWGWDTAASSSSSKNSGTPAMAVLADLAKFGLQIVSQGKQSEPLPLRIGDVDLDGSPDILLIANPINKGGMYDPEITGPRIVTTSIGADSSGLNASVDPAIPPTVGVVEAAFFITGQAGQVDLLLNMKDGKGVQLWSPSLTAVTPAAALFFLKMTGLNGTPAAVDKLVRRYGANYPGMFFCFSFVDSSSELRVRAVSQFSQTSSGRIPLPEAFVGLGKMNTFVETFTAGIPLPDRQPGSTTIDPSEVRPGAPELAVAQWNNRIIPNSNLFLRPPRFAAGEPAGWSIELHIIPSKYTLWIIVALAVSLFALAIAVLVLRRLEMLQDRKEKKSSLHVINFDAL